MVRFGGVALVIGLLFAACAPPEPDGPKPTPTVQDSAAIYVGTVDASEVKVGLVVENGAAALFFCGGATSLGSTKWFRGAAADPKRITFDKDGWKATGDLTDTEASGTIVLGSGAPLPWRASRIAEGSIAGLYESRTSEGTGGVVVSSEDAAQGAFIGPAPNLTVAQIIVIRPIRPETEGIKVKVAEREIFVTRVRPR